MITLPSTLTTLDLQHGYRSGGLSNGDSPQELITNADAALVEAKRLGPGRLRLHVPGERGMPAGPDRRRSLASGRHAADDLVPRFVELVEQRRTIKLKAPQTVPRVLTVQGVQASSHRSNVTTADDANIVTFNDAQQ
jgi:hypothetical protein